MKKLKLAVEELRVESFDTEATRGRAGTVRANESGNPSGYSCLGGDLCYTVNWGLSCGEGDCPEPTAMSCPNDGPEASGCEPSCELIC
jgi:hypothetical protein